MQTLQQDTILQGGKYRIVKVLGQGGFGITYLAIQSGLERKVAIKEFFMKEHCNRDESTSHVSVGSAGSVDMVERFKTKFQKEARNIARLNHPNIVRIIDVFEENATAYYVMEYAEGGSLSEKVKQLGYLSETESIRYVMQVADALAYIHSRNMNHLDIKPANLVLNENDEVILIDFGMSKQYDVTTGGQTSTTPVGISEGYAPMEQYKQGGVGAFSPETDIYALGATFFKLLTGITPPSASDVMEDGIPQDALQTRGISREVIDVIGKAMEGRRKDRMKDVQIFIDRIKCKSTVSSPTVSHNQVRTDIPKDDNTVLINPSPALELNVLCFSLNGVSFDMMPVVGGTFRMGAAKPVIKKNSKKDLADAAHYIQSMDLEADNDESPIHDVTLNDYYIGKTVVTQALWCAVMGDNPSKFKGDNLPVENVNWNDCLQFIKKLNEMTGRDFRLPTEAEWEYAARGGNRSKGYKYSGGDNIDAVAWYEGNGNDKTHPVATKQANELGIYDMSGNVWEWCGDRYAYYSSNAQTNPNGAVSGYYRVFRGGSWNCNARGCRSAFRNNRTPDCKGNFLGFRLLLPV